MSAIWRLLKRQFAHNPLAFSMGCLVAIVPALAGVVLLGVAGWFITVAAIAGVTGVFLNIFAPSAIIRALAIIRTAGRYGERMLTHDATFRFVAALRNDLFSAVARKQSAGGQGARLYNRLTLDIAALDTLYLRLVVPTIVLLAVGFVLVLFWSSKSVLLLAVSAIFLALWFGLFCWIIVRQNENAAKLASAASEAVRIRSSDFATGRRDLEIYGGLDRFADRIVAADSRQNEATWRLSRAAIFQGAASNFIGQVFLAATISAAALSVFADVISPGVAVGSVLIAIAVPEVIALLLPGLANVPRLKLAATRVQSLLEAETAGSMSRQRSPAQQPKGLGQNAVLAFDNVSFAYPGAEQTLLNKISFFIAADEVVALAGRSGCGKSTVASLAARLQKPESGGIYLKGLEYGRVPEDVFRAKVTVLSQQPYFFNDTIAANLRIAKPEASETELWIALAQAALASRISEGEGGLNMVLGEGGAGLSGGELRRLSLARAFLTSPDLLILDEVTEGLDEATATDVLERLLAFRGNAGILMIAHKELELKAADRLLYLGNAGKLEERTG